VRAEFVQLKVNDILLRSRESELKAIRDGFCVATHLQPQLQVLTASDLALIIHGPDHITAVDVLATIRFDEDGFPSGTEMPSMMEAAISSMDHLQLRQLLLFVTGESTIPIGGAYCRSDSGTAAIVLPQALILAALRAMFRSQKSQRPRGTPTSYHHRTQVRRRRPTAGSARVHVHDGHPTVP
jgi:hypothetical protein